MITSSSDVPAAVLRVVRTLHAAGNEAWLVGGCVRDRLQGRPVQDWDVTTDAEPERVIALFERVIPTGLAHGTVTVVVDGTPVETTTYRVEGGYSDGRRPDEVRFTQRLADDLGRRDFTINAMAWDPESDRLVDLYGGQQDLADRVLRTVGAPEARFGEDGLRAMRAIRFATVHALTIEDATWRAIPATHETFRKISVERIQVELAKTLLSRDPGRGLRLLRDSTLLEVILPEAVGVEAAAEALGCVPARIEPRLAVVLHATRGEPGPIVERLRFSNSVRTQVESVLRWRGLAPDASDGAALRRLVARIGRAALDDVLAVQRAFGDPAAWDAFADRIDRAKARETPHTARELALDGRAVMAILGIPPSRRVGELLDALLEGVWLEPDANTPERLTAMLQALAAR